MSRFAARAPHGAVASFVLVLVFFTAAPGLAVSLGAAGVYAGAALSGQMLFTISSGGTVVNGNIFVGDQGDTSTDLAFSGGGNINGTIYQQAGAGISISGGSTCNSTTCVPITLSSGQVSQISSDLAAALAQVSVLSATQSLGAVNFSDGNVHNIFSSGGTNVIDMTSLTLQGGSTLKLNGAASDFYIVRVGSMVLGDVTTGGNSIIDSDGVGAGHVLFVVDDNITMSGGRIDGTYVSVNGDITLSGGVHNGAYILKAAGHQLKFQSAPTVNFVQFVPEPSTASLFGIGLLGLAYRRRHSKVSSRREEGKGVWT